MLKGMEKLENQHEDDYEEILTVFKYGDEELASAVKPEMDRAIKKGEKVIKQHSMMIRGDQKNSLIDDSYLLIGKGKYFNREYLDALENFNYLIQEFPETEAGMAARVWAGKTETALGNYINAKDRFEKVYRDSRLPKDKKALAFASYAQLEINQNRYTGGYQLLQQAIERSSDKEEKVRWMFICGQLQAEMGNMYDAGDLFEKVIKKGPPYELLFQAQLNKARYFDPELRDPEEIYEHLRDMLKDEKNYDNRDIIYYTMAGVAEKLGDYLDQVDFLKKSIRVSTVNQDQKAKSYLKLAEINFEDRIYPTAQAYYDSTFSLISKSHPKYDEIETRKNSLGELVKNLHIIKRQDSLLQISEMSPSQQKQLVRDMIAEMKRRDRERERREQQQANNFALDDGYNSGTGSSGGTGGKWYFYNSTAMSSGQRDFKNRFGNRELKDNWRRKSSGSNSFQTAGGEDRDGGELASADSEGEGEYDAAEYLGNIPRSDTQIAEAHRKIQEAYLEVGSIYKEKLKDLRMAVKELEELLERYDEFPLQGKTWYTLYRLYTTLDDKAMMEKYKNLILTNLPDSEFADLIRNKGKPSQDKNDARDLYVKAYNNYNSSNYSSSLQLARQGSEKYDRTEFGPRFSMLRAMSYGNLKRRQEFVDHLRLVIKDYDTSAQASKARNILQQIGEDVVAKPEKQTTPKTADNSPYALNKNEEHKFVVVLPNKPQADANALTNGLVDFNDVYFAGKDLKAKNILMALKNKLVLVNGFQSKEQAMKYLQIVDNRGVLKNHLKNINHKHFVISNSNFGNFYSKQDIDGYLKFFKANYQND